MKAAVIGPGAIGGLVAGYLALEQENVLLVAHGLSAARSIQDKGLHIQGVRGAHTVKVDVYDKMQQEADLVILATKTQDIEKAIKENITWLKKCLLLTTQNGLQAENIVAKYIEPVRIISSIVMFGATSLKPGDIVHNFEGNWIIGKAFSHNDTLTIEISQLLNRIFPTLVVEDIKSMKYVKIFLNANNCIPALLGVSMQEAFSDLAVSSIGIAIWKEGLRIVQQAGIHLNSLPDFPVERITQLAGLPLAKAAQIYTGIMQGLSKEPLYGSILQSIKRRRPSEIDYINGEFVRLAKSVNTQAPLNEKLVTMVHQVENSKRFFSKQELLDCLKEEVDF